MSRYKQSSSGREVGLPCFSVPLLCPGHSQEKQGYMFVLHNGQEVDDGVLSLPSTAWGVALYFASLCCMSHHSVCVASQQSSSAILGTLHCGVKPFCQKRFCIFTGVCRWLHACECALLTEYASLHLSQLQHPPLPWPQQPQDRPAAG